ncbi:inner-membrane translocator [Caldicellulosiruptor hydrothermalis 108]|uniref:Inner-membrane translocator n=1 Tax=Caldicellulosiruptor hydrothermalis (strain DSM 18901 / VKM B-2411 / 108) TaxID=632292 RepID=E4QDA9_CALH1|nr:ABC transporter permease [Caldicellulosiruptor hydrothermalis]ADQ06404.1 inner-membrane translocator [Caldicellulosiruptor hydrothermalis 108]
MGKKSKLSLMNTANFQQIGLLIFIVGLSIVVQIRNPRFLTFENISDLLTNTAILAILTVGMMLVIVTRGIDLSVGSVLALAGMISALIVSKYQNVSPIVAILIGIFVGAICGVINGFLISKTNILPIIATLGTMNIYRGITYMISKGQWVSADEMPLSFKRIATGSILGINNLIVVAIITYIVFYYFVQHTRTGRQIYAIGSNPEAARISGINVSKLILTVYFLMGVLSGLAGVLWVSKFASAQSDTATGYEMNVIAAAVLGGVSIAGGSGRISGIILGTLLLGILNNALPLVNVSPFWQQAIQGFIILIAVIVNVLVRMNMEKAQLRRRGI